MRSRLQRYAAGCCQEQRCCTRRSQRAGRQSARSCGAGHARTLFACAISRPGGLPAWHACKHRAFGPHHGPFVACTCVGIRWRSCAKHSEVPSVSSASCGSVTGPPAWERRVASFRLHAVALRPASRRLHAVGASCSPSACWALASMQLAGAPAPTPAALHRHKHFAVSNKCIHRSRAGHAGRSARLVPSGVAHLFWNPR